MTTVFVVILLANSLTLVITIVAAIKRPSLSYMLIGAVALCATLFALQQVVTGQGESVRAALHRSINYYDRLAAKHLTRAKTFSNKALP